MTSETLTSTQAAKRARRQATVVAAGGAAVPTVLAAQGMTALAIDLLGFPVPVAVALASFLELALVSSALLARAAALAGRPGGADAMAVWVVSGTSGFLAGLHELVMTGLDGSSTWTADPRSLLAAAVRLIAPLVAAWLWERVLRAARAEQAERTLAEVRRDRRLLAVARAALHVRRLDTSGLGASRRARRAARRLDRAHIAALRVVPPAPTLTDVLAAVGQVDHLPAGTAVAPLLARPRLEPVRARAAAAGVRPTAITQTVTEPARALTGTAAATDNGPDTLAAAVDVVRGDPTVSGARLAEELTRSGWPMSTRSGQRWRGRALAALATAPVR